MEKSKDGNSRLFISHLPTDEQMKDLIAETGCGVESIEFSMASSLDRLPESICAYEKRLEFMGNPECIFHGPFLDLNPMAFDSMVL